MCLVKAFIREDGEEKLVMEDITLIRIEHERLVLSSLFGEQKEIEAHIKEINFLHHSITLGGTRPVEVRK